MDGKEDLREQVRSAYESGAKRKDIVEQYGISLNTLKSWIRRGNWQKKGAPHKERVHPQPEKKVHPEVQGAEGAPAPYTLLDPVQSAAVESVLQNPDLTDQQKEFCLYHVMAGLSKTDAAIKAGYSEKTAAQIGYKLSQKSSVREEIAQLRKIKLENLVFTVDELVEYHIRAFRADITKYVTFGTVQDQSCQDGEKPDPTKMRNVMFFKKSDDVDGTLINKISVSKDGAAITLVDKKDSIRFLEQYCKVNYMDQHRMDMDRLRYELEKKKAGIIGGDGAPASGAQGSQGAPEPEEVDVVIYIPDNGRDDDGE